MTAPHKWEFKACFRRRAFGWRSQPAITRIKEAVREIKKVAKADPIVAAEGAVLLLERLSPALEQIDSSSGAIGAAVDSAIAELVSVLVAAPVDAQTREAWLERLDTAHTNDEIPYIERLADYWGELCASKEIASAWANRLMAPTRVSLRRDEGGHQFFRGTTSCLSALFRAERYDEIVALVENERFWLYRQWGAKALAATGKKAEAIRFAEARRGLNDGPAIDRLCEEILLSSGLTDEAYVRYGLRTHDAGTNLATFRAVARTYPHKRPSEILGGLVASSPGDEGKWFAAAKEVGLLDEALVLAARSPTDPKTLTRAARDFADENPAFAVEAGLLAIDWLVRGHGYDITGADVAAAFDATMKAATRAGSASSVLTRVRQLVERDAPGASFVRSVLGRALGI